MKNVFLIFSICATLFSLRISAQQTPVYSDYNDNAIILNPAHSGLGEDFEISLTNRGIFNSFEGAPSYTTASASISREYSGFGAGILRDEVGVSRSTQFFASYAYRIFLSYDSNVPRYRNYERDVLSFGISAGLQQYSENLLDLGIDNDPLFANNVSATIPTIGAGVLFNKKSFFIGLSAPNIIGDLLSNESGIEISVPYYGYGGYKFLVGATEEFLIKPNFLVKVETGAPVQLDTNLFVNYKNIVEVGSGYRTGGLVNFLAGFYLKDNFKFNYSFNYATNDSPIGSTQGFSISYKAGRGYGGVRN